MPGVSHAECDVIAQRSSNTHSGAHPATRVRNRGLREVRHSPVPTAGAPGLRLCRDRLLLRLLSCWARAVAVGQGDTTSPACRPRAHRVISQVRVWYSQCLLEGPRPVSGQSRPGGLSAPDRGAPVGAHPAGGEPPSGSAADGGVSGSHPGREDSELGEHLSSPSPFAQGDARLGTPSSGSCVSPARWTEVPDQCGDVRVGAPMLGLDATRTEADRAQRGDC